MGFFGRIGQSLRKDRDTLRGLGWRQRIRFCLDYYKGWLFLALAAGLLLFYLWDLAYQSRQTILLQGFFVNDNHNLFPARPLSEEFSEYMGISGHQRIAFEDSLFVDLESGSEYHAASQSKIVVYTAAKELDFLVAPEDLARRYCQAFPLMDLETLIPDGLKEGLEDSLYVAEDGSGTLKACALDLSGSRFLRDAPEEACYYLLVFDYSERSDALQAFLRFAYQ